MTKNNIIEMMIISDVSNTNIYSIKPSLKHCFTFMYINAIEVCIELYFIQIGDKTKLPVLYCMSVRVHLLPEFSVALSLFDMLWGFIRGVLSQNFSFLGGHLLPAFFEINFWATLIKWKIQVGWKYDMRHIQRKVLIHRVEIQRLFSIIFITDVDRSEKLQKSRTFVYLEQNVHILAYSLNCVKYK